MNFLRGTHFRRRKLHKLMLIVLIDLHDTGFVPTPVTIIWRRPNCHQTLVPKIVHVPFLDQLMGPCDRVQVVNVQKFLSYLLRKQIPSASVTDRPALDMRVRVGPDEVAHIAGFRDLTNALNIIDFVQEWNVRWEAAMNAHEGVVKNGD